MVFWFGVGFLVLVRLLVIVLVFIWCVAFCLGFVYGVCFDCGCYLRLVGLLLGLLGFGVDCLVRLLVWFGDFD